jgi:PAS domain S-box-containing protein
MFAFLTDLKLLIIIILVITNLVVIFLYIRKTEVAEQSSDDEMSQRFLNKRKQLRSLIDAMPDSIYIKDRGSRFVVANKQIAAVMGVEHPRDVIGKTDFDFYEEEIAREYFNDEQEIIKTGEPVINKEEYGRDGKGHLTYKSTTKVPYFDDNSEIIGIIGIGRDISKQKEVEKELRLKSRQLGEINQILEERQEEIQQQSEILSQKSDELEKERNTLRAFIDNMPDRIYIKDTEGKFITGNKELVSVMNAGFVENLVGKTDYDFYPDEMAENFFNDDMEIIKTGQSIINKEEIGWSADRKKIIVSTTKVPIRNANGEIIGLVGLGRDITKQKENEKSLIRQSESLQEVNVLLEERQEEIQQQKEELHAQAENLREINMQLENANKTKDKFFSIIAHDLKNPFHAITGFTNVLTASFNEMNEQRKLELIELIKTSSENAYNLLENLLQWARTQTDRIQYNPVLNNLNEIIDQNLYLLKASLNSKNLSVEKKVITCRVFVDVQMIGTVIRNLLSNSVKFSNPGGTIYISCEELQDQTLITIKDDGVGIPQENLDKLFQIDQYYSTTGTEGESGTGLGLIICKEFVAKNKGEIKVQSAENKGTTFYVYLPKNVIQEQ